MATLAAWLEEIGLGGYRTALEREAIELEDLELLSEADLERLGLPMGPRKRLLDSLARKAAPLPATIAERVQRSQVAIEGERRLVTILFADVAGSTALVQQLGPEAVTDLFDPLQRLMLDAVHAHGGTVNEVLGDGIMAIFGAPLAQEDHALRACQAAIAMQAGTGELRLRIGLNSGEAVVRMLANDVQASYSAMGATTHLAARMEQTAAPDTIRLAEPTFRLIEDFVRTRPLPPFTVKGFDLPIRAFELLGLLPPRSRLEARIARRVSPFVGRERERAHLLDRFAAAEAGNGHAVAIVGEPGLGKSRLLHELREALGGRAQWQLGQCVSNEAREPFHPISDLLRRHFKIADGDPPEARTARVMDSLDQAGDPAMARAAPYLAFLVGGATPDSALASDPQLRRADIFDAVIQLILNQAEKQPQVVVIEDLHWADQATLELVERLVDALALSPVLLLATTRPGAGRFLPERGHTSRLVLGGLGADDAARLLAAMLDAGPLAEPLARQVLAKAEGNPFFVEELARSLHEAGSLHPQAGTVPDTIQQVLQARIDRLDTEARRTLQIASVIGRSFDAALLGEITGPNETALRTLLAAELIQLKATAPDAVYLFKHALIQDVAYGSLLLRTKKPLHLRITAAIERPHGARLGEHHGTLGHHYSQAEDWLKAAHHLAAAADRAAEAAAPGDAVSLLDRAIDCLERTPAPPAGELAALLTRQAAWLQIVSRVDEAHDKAARAAALARDSGLLEIEGRAAGQMGLASFYLHRFDQGRTEARHAIAIGQRIGSAEVQAAGGCALGWIEAVSGELPLARRTLGTAEAVARAASLEPFEIIATAVLAQMDHWQGDPARALDRLRGQTLPALAAREQGAAPAFLFPHLLTLFSLGLPLAGKGAYGEAYAVFGEGLALAERVGDEVFRMRFLNSLGHVLAECGNLEAARPLNERSRELGLDRGDNEVAANAELNLADGFLATGDTALARDICAGVHGVVKSPTTSDFMRWRYSQHLFASMGKAWLAGDEPTKAATCADQCLELATRTRSRKYLARGWRLKAAATRARGDVEAAEGMLRQALVEARRARHPSQIWRAELALGSLLQDAGKGDAARRRFVAARRTVASIGKSLDGAALAQDFAGTRLFDEAFGHAGAGCRTLPA